MRQVKMSFRISEDDLKKYGFNDSSINYFFGKLDEKKDEGMLSKFIKECIFKTYDREMNGIHDEEKQKEDQLKKMLDALPAQLSELIKKEISSMAIVSAGATVSPVVATEEKLAEEEGKKASKTSKKKAVQNMLGFMG